MLQLEGQRSWQVRMCFRIPISSWVVASLWLFFGCSCSSSKETGVPPQDLLDQFFLSISEGDEDLFLSLFKDAVGDNRTHVVNYFYVLSTDQFLKAELEERFGSNAVTLLNKINPSGRMVAFSPLLNEPVSFLYKSDEGVFAVLVSEAHGYQQPYYFSLHVTPEGRVVLLWENSTFATTSSSAAVEMAKKRRKVANLVSDLENLEAVKELFDAQYIPKENWGVGDEVSFLDLLKGIDDEVRGLRQNKWKPAQKEKGSSRQGKPGVGIKGQLT